MNDNQASVLVVDDNEINCDLLARRLKKQGYQVTLAADGATALALLQSAQFDLVLLDIMMPQMNGYEVLEQLKADPILRYVPVIVISALDEIDSVVKCIELGAEDYLPKPFNPVLLKARVNSCLEKKRWRDRELAYLEEIKVEREKTERLLLNILPKAVAEQLKNRQGTIAENFATATVLFADLVNFTQLAADKSPIELVSLLNEIFSAFDRLATKYELEKIKTIGDAYMVVGGIPTPRTDHAEAIAQMALDMLIEINQFNSQIASNLNMRVGINTGPVVAGVIGTNKFIYDLWGDTVNTASRMESHGIPGYIQVTNSTYNLLKDKFTFKERGVINIKGKGEMSTYLLINKNL